MSQTGEHAAVPDKPATFEQDAKGLWGRVFTPTARVVVASLFVGGVGATGTYSLAQSKFDSQDAKAAIRVDAGVKALRDELDPRMTRIERQMERVLDAMQAAEDRNAKRFDALQNTILERRAQPESAELARPASLTDGGR